MLQDPRIARSAGAATLALLLTLAAHTGALAKNEPPDLAAFQNGGNGSGAAPLSAVHPPHLFAHDVGALFLEVTNIGMFGNSRSSRANAGWRGGEYLYEAGIWIGAKRADGVPRVTTGVPDLELEPPGDPVWTVYETFEGARGGGRLGFLAEPRERFADGVGNIRTSGANDDWNGGADTEIDEDFLNGIDDDGDGLVDEDFEAIGQQMFSCEYWDVTPETRARFPDHRPLDLLVQQRSFQWATAGANEFVGIEFDVWNIGNETLNDVFIAFFVDSDVGPPTRPNFWLDDKVGFVSRDSLVVDDSLPERCQDRIVSVDVMYAFDTPDVEITEPGAVIGGDVPGFFGAMFLGHTTDPLGLDAPQEVQIRTARSFTGSDPYPDGDPRNDAERYDLISRRGLPVFDQSRDAADYRFVIAAGPFRSLPPDTSLTFQTAFVVGHGLNGMVANAIQAQIIYEGVWRDADASEQTGSLGRETCIRPPGNATQVQWTDPCDSLDTSITIGWNGHCGADSYVDADCDACTPLALSSDPGPEMLVNWVGPVSPAPPTTNTECDQFDVQTPAGDGRVVLQWNNLSELRADPIQRRTLHEGYRIWRVDGWRRPVGSSGPAPHEWQLIAEFLRSPADPPDICEVTDPRSGKKIPFSFNIASQLGNWTPHDPLGILPDDPCEVCPEFCRPARHFHVDDLLAPIETGVATGDTTDGREFANLFPIGYYTYVDDTNLKNGMIYFYDVTAFSAWDEVIVDETTTPPTETVRHFELAGRPAARECQMVVPTWPARDTKREIYVVPNPYVQSDRTVLPWGWDLIPSLQDPVGTRIAFANLPRGRNDIKIYTLAGDLVTRIDAYSSGENGTAFWNLVSRKGQDVVAGVYLFSVRTEDMGTQVGRFVIVR